MTDECRPPDGTADGTACWLFAPALNGLAGTHEAVLWRTTTAMDWWERFGNSQPWSPGKMAGYGYRFHSIAEPPHE